MRTARVFDGIEYAPGKKMRVLRECTWAGMKPIVGGFQGTGGTLKPGDVVTCLGFGAGWGSDPGYGVEFSIEDWSGSAEIQPMVGGIWAYRPAPGLLEVVDE